MKKGKLIVIEGACDGIGKTTQYNKLMERLKQDGYSVYNHHFPSYNTYQGKPVEKYLNGDYGTQNELSCYFINSLYATDRGVTWYEELKKEYDSGKIILLDRYTTSSLIYQSSLLKTEKDKKEFIDFVEDFEYEKIGIKKPDLVIFLNADYDIADDMRKNRDNYEGNSNDIHEKNTDFMKKVYENANFVAKYLSWNVVNCDDGNSMKSIDVIHDEIYKIVEEKI